MLVRWDRLVSVLLSLTAPPCRPFNVVSNSPMPSLQPKVRVNQQPPTSAAVCLPVCRTLTARRCCCSRCPPSRSAWTWSWDPPSSCVTRSSASRWPSTSSLPNEDPSGAPHWLKAPKAAIVVSRLLEDKNVRLVRGTPRSTLEPRSVRNLWDYEDILSLCFFSSVFLLHFYVALEENFWHL